MAKICILDGFTSNPGDLSWDEIGKLGECAVYDRTTPEQLAERAGDADIVLTNKVVLGLKEIGQLPKLKYIGVLATGYNVVDLRAATERGIVVTNIPAPTFSTSPTTLRNTQPKQERENGRNVQISAIATPQ